ncbi:hypothetical protein BD309DRAFT_988313 [Dichomitus squalens]|uniref:Uncharacterized protein n=2 Tax=Dichomitus squalens TaxID=114155 RepID=A0A4Q9MC85_9APHY|nr:uncharacterized protein DICSQDRAFT_140842 [Dichomitus squalens LYAD-421 SS1]EJF56907.1 hypothetical protein DICSQDRAFT_140842 [Dichomitus squalens LYAD-421 SS1]TBU23908.1 hypothetical protein BD311DRAFT_672939 [Dichomitus squalens]TBU47102.1 hypothetical protein BD309DRAFT_988313 [Dichomitus squalens]TBU60770.1 hypothetical protein BD310DRAFT_947052 [Dichomitus squalens]
MGKCANTDFQDLPIWDRWRRTEHARYGISPPFALSSCASPLERGEMDCTSVTTRPPP